MRTRTAWLVCLTLGCMLLTLLAPAGAQLPAAATASAAATNEATPHLADQCEAPMLADGADTETGTLRGEVLSEAGEPRAAVMLVAEGPWGLRQNVYSDADGTYRFDDLPAGRYTLRVFESSGEALDVLSSATVAVAADAEAELVLHVAASAATTAPTSEDVRLAQTGTITGQVTAEDTGLPLSNVTIQLYTTDGTIEDSTLVDTDGFYELADVPNGSYRLRFNPSAFGDASDYAFEYYENAASLADATDVVVNDNTVTDINGALPRSGFVTGAVTGADTGTPLQNIRVQVFERDQRLNQQATTDSTGVYSLTQLHGGSYFIKFTPPSFGDAALYAAEYYDNQRMLDTADTIAVTSGDTTFAIDAALEQSGTISGQVTGSDTGSGLADVNVRIYDSEGSVVTSDTTDSTGTYSVTGLLSDTYRIEFSPSFFGSSELYLAEFHEDKLTLEAADPVAVPLGTDATIDAVLDKGGILSGQVTGSDTGSGLADVDVFIYDSEGSVVTSDTTDSTGAYSVTGLLSDTYRIEFSPFFFGSSELYLAEFHEDKLTLEAADPVAIQLNDEVTIDAALRRGATISGQVTDADSGTGIDAFRPSLYTDEGQLLPVIPIIEANGVYTISKLRAGSYYLIFRGEENYLDQAYNNQSFLGAADLIQVAVDEDKTNIDAALAQGGSISGQVTAEDTGAGLPSVDVNIYDYCTGNFIGNTSTDADGNYTVDGLPTGRYFVLFDTDFTSASEYLPEYYDDLNEQGTSVAVNAPSVTDGIDAELALGGVITGTVTAEDTGEPLEDVRVDPDGTDGPSINLIPSERTSITGTYRIEGLPADEYTLEFETLASGEASRYLDEYYDNQPDDESATRLSVALGQEIANVDAALAPGGTISGEVTADADGSPLDDVRVEVRTPADNVVAMASTTVSGTYSVVGLSPGTYIVRFLPDTSSDYILEYYDDVPSSDLATTVGVSGTEEISDINAALARGSAISGRVTAEDTGSTLFNVVVEVRNADGVTFRSVATSLDGTYRVGGLPAGSYIVEFVAQSFGASANYLDEYYDNQPDAASATPVDVTLDQDTTDIDAALALGGTIQGRVTRDADGAGLRDVRVQIYDSNDNVDNLTFPDMLGFYRFEGLAPGSYKLNFDPGFNRCTPLLEEYYNDKPDLVSADPVEVTSGGTSTADAGLAGAGAISGRVTADDTGSGLEDVRITVYNSEDGVADTTRTDPEGNYTTPALPDGTYRLRFETPASGTASGYIGEYYDDKASLETADGITVTAPSVTTTIDAVLAAGASITGTVTAEDTGTGLENVPIFVYDSTGAQVAAGITSADGTYTTGAVPDGSYRVRFGPIDGYVQEFYDDKGSLEAADEITVAAPDDTTSIDAALAVAPEPGQSLYLPLIAK